MLAKPLASSAVRMAPTRPSIMSLGAMISMPARACETAVLARISRVGSLAISNASAANFSASAAADPVVTTVFGPPGFAAGSTMPQCPWLMYSHRQTSPITIRPGTAALMARVAFCTMPSSAQAPVATSSFFSGSPNRITAGMPSDFTSRHSFTVSSMERLNTPGILPIGLRTPSPAQTNSG